MGIIEASTITWGTQFFRDSLECVGPGHGPHHHLADAQDGAHAASHQRAPFQYDLLLVDPVIP